MAKSSNGVLEIVCPCCEASLKIDAETGVVLSHKEKERPAPVEDLREAVARIKRAESERDAQFQRQVDRERANQASLDKKFDELLKQAKADPNKRPPRNPFDLE